MKNKKQPVPKISAEDRGTPAAAPKSFFRPELLSAGALFLIAFVLYIPSYSNGFVFFDDDKAILYNKTLTDPSLGRFFTGQNLGMYAPLTWIFYWIGHGISGQEASGYHLLGGILHAFNALLAYAVILKLFKNGWIAFATALLFAVHPVQVEAVSWAAALSTVLFSFFYLASLFAYLKWKEVNKAAWLGASLLLFLSACLSKSAAVTLPLVLIAIDWIDNKNQKRNFWLSKILYLLIALVFGLYTFSTRAAEGHDIAASSAVFSAADRFFMVSQSILFYPVKLLFPLGFSVAYPFVKTGGGWHWTYYAAPVVLAAAAFGVWKKGLQNRTLLLGLALYLLPLAVMLPFRTVGSFELRSDRYAYISCIGIFLMLAAGANGWSTTVKNAVLAAVAVTLMFLTRQQIEVWEDGVSLFENCTAKTPESSLCQCNLAYNSLITNQYEKSVRHYTEALKYDPNTVEAYNGRGQAYLQLRKIPEALSDFDNAIKAGIVTPKLFLNRGKCLVMLNRPAEAAPDLDKSLELEPKNPETWYFRAVCREKAGHTEGAISDYSKAVELNPNYVEALVNRGLLYYNRQGYETAIADYTTALSIASVQVQPMILVNRANAWLQAGAADKALTDADKAVQLNAGYGRAYQTRAAIYNKMGMPEKARADMAKASGK